MFGPGGISPVQLLIVFGIVILIFGTAKLKNFGGDLGGALKGFKKAMSDDEETRDPPPAQQARRIEADVRGHDDSPAHAVREERT